MSGRSGRVKPASLAGECGIKKGESHSVEDCALSCMSAVLSIQVGFGAFTGDGVNGIPVWLIL